MSGTITDVRGRIVLNSRGSETIEVDVITDGIHLGRAAAPSGASVGMHEATAFPDGGPQVSLDALKRHRKLLVGMDAADTQGVHEALRQMDSTPDYSAIGGSLAYAVSVAAAHSGAESQNIPLYHMLGGKKSYTLPIPLGNILGGGAHAGPGTPDIQEILVCTMRPRSIRESIQTNIRVHQELGRILGKMDPRFTRGRGDEGGWAPALNSEESLEAAARACESLGYTLGREISLGVDFASSTQYDAASDTYRYERSGFNNDPGEQVEFVSDIIQRYKLIYAEDCVHEEDFNGMAEIALRFPDTLVTGDDLTVTNHEILRRAVSMRSCSAAILKVNQAGSLHDALRFSQTAADNNIRIITSHRSGESTNSHITHVGIATGSVMLKVGVVGGERVAKLNELLRVSEHDLIQGPASL